MSYLDFGLLEAETMKELVIEALITEVRNHVRTKQQLQAYERQQSSSDSELIVEQLRAEKAEERAQEMENKVARLLVVCQEVLTEEQFLKVRGAYEEFDEQRTG